MLITLALAIISKNYETKLAEETNTDIDCAYIDISDIDQVKEECSNVLKANKEKGYYLLLLLFKKNGLRDFIGYSIEQYVFPYTDMRPSRNLLMTI